MVIDADIYGGELKSCRIFGDYFYFTEAWETTLYTLNPDDMSVDALFEVFEGELMTPMRYLNFVDKIIYIVYPGWGDIGEVMSVFIGIPQVPGPDYTSG